MTDAKERYDYGRIQSVSIEQIVPTPFFNMKKNVDFEEEGGLRMEERCQHFNSRLEKIMVQTRFRIFCKNSGDFFQPNTGLKIRQQI